MRPRLSSEIALTIVGRLEAATSRLEDMVPNMADPAASTNGSQSTSGQGSTSAGGMGQARGNVQSPKHMEALPPVIDDFDAIINGEVKTFVNMSEEIGGLVAEQVCQLYNGPRKRRAKDSRSDTLPTSLLPYFELSPPSASF